MTEPARIRNCYELCRSTLRNAAFYKGAASLGAQAKPTSQFAIAASNNFLDMAFLEWCKVFADIKGKHHWKKILPVNTDFMQNLLTKLVISNEEFEVFAHYVMNYRNKVIAHADVYTEIDIPTLDLLINSTIYLYQRLRDDCGSEPQPAAPHDLCAAFQFSVDEGRQQFVAMATAG